MTVRTRFAPSPTGRLHLGNVRVAVFNWLFARHHQGAFVLRLEDTDVERNLAGAEDSLMEDVRWLGLDWDEGPDVGGALGPYRQSERTGHYEAALERLLTGGSAFRCFCEAVPENEAGRGRYQGGCGELDPHTTAERAAAGAPHVVRFRSARAGVVTVTDVVRGEIAVDAGEIDDFVLRRTDGRVTYNFAVVVDDIAMEISHVIRGAGHLSNTPRQALLFDALGAERPIFAHLPHLLDAGGGKLSKRTGALSVEAYREAGYLPDALVNYLSLLGWSDPEGEEILTRDDLMARISLDRIGVSDAQLDTDKLHWVGSRHMAVLPPEVVAAGVRSRVDQVRFPKALGALDSVVAALRTRLAAFGEINDHLALIFSPDDEAEAGRQRLAGDEAARAVLQGLHERLEALAEWEPGRLGESVRQTGKALGVRGPGLFHPVRLAVTGHDQGPDLAHVLHALGRTTVMERIRNTLSLGP